MAVVQTITNTRLSGTHTFPLNPTAQGWHTATVVIDRTVTGGLNSLTTADTLELDFDYAPDGASFVPFAGLVLVGGLIDPKGTGPLTQDVLTLQSGVQPFPVGTGFQVRTNASTPVRVAGTVTYDV